MQIAKAWTRVNIRTAPGLKGKIQRVLAVGDIGVTWLPPAEADGHTWYFLQLPKGETGWAAVKDGGTVLLELKAMPFEFLEALEFTLRWEGGYVNNPADPGGETKFGISKLSYPLLDIKNLTKEQASAIYYLDYWLPSFAGNYTPPMDLLLFDIAVLCGVHHANGYLDHEPLDILCRQYAYFTGLSSFTVFGRGWTNRTTDLLEIVAGFLDEEKR